MEKLLKENYCSDMKKALHEGYVIKFKFKNKDFVFDVGDGYVDNLKRVLTFKNAIVTGEELDTRFAYREYECKILENNKYYLRIDNTEIVGDDYEVKETYFNEIVAKYDLNSKEFSENLKSIENYLDDELIEFIKYNGLSMNTTMDSYNYDKDKFEVIYNWYDKKIKITFIDADIKLYYDYDEVNLDKIEEAFKYLNDCMLEECKKVNNQGTLNGTWQQIFNYHGLSIKKIENGYDCRIELLTDKTDEIKIICTNIKYTVY